MGKDGSYHKAWYTDFLKSSSAKENKAYDVYVRYIADTSIKPINLVTRHSTPAFTKASNE